MAFSMLLAHLFGDIPSPPILGFLLDYTTDYTGTHMCKPGWNPYPAQTQCVLDNNTAACGVDGAVCTLPGSIPGCEGCSRCGGDYWLQHKQYEQLKGDPGSNPCATLPCIHLGTYSTNTHGNYRLVMGTACGWLIWTVVLWSMAYRIFKRNPPGSSAVLMASTSESLLKPEG